MNDHRNLPQPGSDDWLSQRLTAMLDVAEPVPTDALEAAYAAFQMGDLDRELAALVFDSLESAGAPALLTLATRAAEATGAKGAIPAVADVAARGGSTRLVTEAARLHRALAT